MLTKLEVINAMVASTGTAPLATNDTRHPFYIKASAKLATVSREVQSTGWWFNKSVRTLQPTLDGELILPSTALHVDPVDRGSKLVRRGTRLFDPDMASYTIGKPVRINYVELLEIEEMPPQAVAYIKARAVFEFYLDEDGNEPKLSNYRAERDSAWIGFKAEHLKNADVNFFSGTSAMQTGRGNAHRRLPLSDE
jgi:hypothetical protein